MEQRRHQPGSHPTLEIISATIADGVTAIKIILPTSLGLIVQKITIDRLGNTSRQARP